MAVEQNWSDIICLLQSMMTHHVMIGVQLLSQLVCEMNQVSEVGFCLVALEFFVSLSVVSE